MDSFRKIQDKLEGFIKRYYTNELLKGVILFFAIGLLYLLFTLFIEYALWLGTRARTVLFWLFVTVELALLIKFIIIPIAKLFKLKTGINYKDASKIIGNHFAEVNDKLLNVLQLNENPTQSELLLASIEQKSLELKPIPFKLAINFKQNVKYLKYAAIPVIILLITFLTDNLNWFSNSYNRVVHYKTEYEPPAPFQFFVVNDKLQTIENKDFKLVVKTVGDLIPEGVQIEYNNEVYFMHNTGIGVFEHNFNQPKVPINFVLSANNVTSKSYELVIIEAPSLLGFEMYLDYPKYTKKKDESLKSTGNALVPEGTFVTWKFETKSTDFVNLYAEDTLKLSTSNKGVFEASKRVLKNLDYRVSTSNKNLINYENLSFRIDVVRDQFPELNIKMQMDTLDLQTLYFFGQATDDYGFHKLQLVYYPSNDEEAKQTENIPIGNSNVSEFISAFPNNLEIQDGISYNLYFQVFDNDVVNKYKSVKSSIYTYRKRTKEEEVQKQLSDQNKTIKDLNKSFKKFQEQEKTLEELSRTQKEKSSLNFNDKKKLESFLKRQKQQDQMMKNFNKKFKENLEQFQDENIKDEFKEDLKERLKDNEEQLEKDEKLLEELEKLKDKISKEEFVVKLEELAKQNKNKKRSLEQLLELTKRFYVEKKLQQLADDLNKLSEEQDKLSQENNKNNTPENQEKLNKEFEDFTKELEDLKKDNKALKKPMEIPQDKLEENEIKKEQQQAAEDLKKSLEEELNQNQDEQKNDGNQNQEQQNQSKQNAQKSQKNAAKKMKQMAKSMQSSMNASGGEQLQEDMEMLRQILDNLLLYSFDQEGLMDKFKRVDINHSKFASYLKKQQILKEHFEHIDDSLFALSLRQPKLSESVNKEISEVYFNIDKAMGLLAENELYQGIGAQQFAVTAANNLADFLSNILDNMQESLSMSPGKGQGNMQLPDIIMSQEQLQKMLEEGMKKSKEGKQQNEGEGKKGEKGKEMPSDGKSKNGEGDGNNEELNGLLFEIYQQQQQLREALKDKIAKDGLGNNANSLVRKMEDIELELLNKGFTNSVLSKMMELKHQLLKLENASHEQGEDEKRESKTNQDHFNNNPNNIIPKAKQYFNTIEILDKQALPLKQIYRKKVQEYFKTSDD